MSLQLASPISWPLLIVVASWSILLFCGFGILSRLNVTTLAALSPWILRNRQRDIPHPRIERTLQRDVQSPPSGDATGDRGA